MSFRLPWVSRAEYDHLRIQILEERMLRGQAERSADIWERTSHQLSGQIVELTASLPMAVLKQPPNEPSAVSRIIREQAQGPDGREDLGLARHLRTYAGRLRREKKSEDEIAAALVAWQTTELAKGS